MVEIKGAKPGQSDCLSAAVCYWNGPLLTSIFLCSHVSMNGRNQRNHTWSEELSTFPVLKASTVWTSTLFPMMTC